MKTTGTSDKPDQLMPEQARAAPTWSAADVALEAVLKNSCLNSSLPAG